MLSRKDSRLAVLSAESLFTPEPLPGMTGWGIPGAAPLMEAGGLSGGSRQYPWSRLVLGKGRRCSHQALELGQSDMGQGFKDLLVVPADLAGFLVKIDRRVSFGLKRSLEVDEQSVFVLVG